MDTKENPIIIKETDFIIENSNNKDGFKVKITNIKKIEAVTSTDKDDNFYFNNYNYGHGYD